MNNLTAQEKRELRRLIKVVERFRYTDERMTVSAILALLHTAVEPEPVVQKTIEEKLQLSNATASRSVAYWKRFRVRQTPGQDMLDTYPDPDNGHYKRIELKPKGLKFIRDLLEDMEHGRKKEDAE